MDPPLLSYKRKAFDSTTILFWNHNYQTSRKWMKRRINCVSWIGSYEEASMFFISSQPLLSSRIPCKVCRWTRILKLSSTPYLSPKTQKSHNRLISAPESCGLKHPTASAPSSIVSRLVCQEEIIPTMSRHLTPQSMKNLASVQSVQIPPQTPN